MPPQRRPRSDDLVQAFPNKRWDHYNDVQRLVQGEETGGGGLSGAGPFPRSGIFGWVKATGDGIGNPAYIQWLNPDGSGVNVAIYELYVSYIAHASAATIYARKSATPVTLVLPLAAALQHLDEQDVTTIHSFLLGGNDGGAVIGESGAHFYIPAIVPEGEDQWKPFEIRGVGMSPLILGPGEAFELSADDDDVLTTIRVWGVVSEDQP